MLIRCLALTGLDVNVQGGGKMDVQGLGEVERAEDVLTVYLHYSGLPARRAVSGDVQRYLEVSSGYLELA